MTTAYPLSRQQVVSQICFGGKFATGINDTGGKIATVGTISDCLHIKVNLKKKNLSIY
jgi:hypothetical protein